MRPCAVFRALLHKLRLRDSVGSRCGWIERSIGVLDIKEIVMAKVIEFYIPARFRKPLRAAPQVQFGKLVEFCLPTKKSA
ncbi:MAG: hypothetical protein QOF56_2251 [Acidobacteriaceae bacterium]|jgi:hypothetical protein|nr:hypothetical protein [Acidobacteriaceae bacterium]